MELQWFVLVIQILACITQSNIKDFRNLCHSVTKPVDKHKTYWASQKPYHTAPNYTVQKNFIVCLYLLWITTHTHYPVLLSIVNYVS